MKTERKNTICQAACVAVIFACALLVCFYCFAESPFPALPAGRTIYYYKSRSSNALMLSDDVEWHDRLYFGYKSKSVFVSADSAGYTDKLLEIERLIVRFSMREVWRETVGCGAVTCVYYYSEKIPFYQIISCGNPCGEAEDFRYASGKAVKVNFHVAYSSRGVSVGCPFIYGGY